MLTELTQLISQMNTEDYSLLYALYHLHVYQIVGLGPSNRTIVGNNEIRLVSNESQRAVPKRG